MLIPATLDDVERYCDFIYEIALDQARSCYPVYTDGIKAKEDFISAARKGVEHPEYELLLFATHGNVEGWLEYFWIPEDRYLQLCACNIRRNTEAALGELISRLDGRFPGYTYYFGFPDKNTAAIAFLKEKGFQCIEEDWNNTFFFDEYIPLPGDPCITKIGRENFADFQVIYKPGPDTYWTGERIFEQLEEWNIFVYYNGATPVGTIFFCGDNGYYEIFGTDLADGGTQENIYRALLIASLNYCKQTGAKYMTYFCCDDWQHIPLELGFRCVGKYLLYIK